MDVDVAVAVAVTVADSGSDSGSGSGSGSGSDSDSDSGSGSGSDSDSGSGSDSGSARWALLLLLLPGIAHARPITVVAGGDLQLGPTTRGRDLAKLLPLFRGADLRFANLEGPLVDGAKQSGLDAEGRPIRGEAVRFAAPAALARSLSPSLNVVSLANNHALDQGEAGRGATARALGEAGIGASWDAHAWPTLVAQRAPIGPPAPAPYVPWPQRCFRDTYCKPGSPRRCSLDIRCDGGLGQLVGPAPLNPSGPPRPVTLIAHDFSPNADLDGDQPIIDEVRAASARGPVIVSLHWGHTDSLLPTAAQRALAKRLVAAGASAILGHGPHSAQGVERIGGAVVAYSMGNLALACRCSEERDAFLLRFQIDDDGAAREVALLPLVAGTGGALPVRSDEPDLAALLENLSRDLGSKTHRDGASVVIE